jgi:hypothetical protein
MTDEESGGHPVAAEIRLERALGLPRSTQSLLFRFGEVAYGGLLVADGDLRPECPIHCTLELWEMTPRSGDQFVVWYDGDVGEGRVL